MPAEFPEPDSLCLQRMRSILDCATDAYLLHDAEGKILDVNERLCTWLGYTRDDLLGLNYFNIDSRTPQDLHQLWQESPQKTKPQRLICHYRCKDGKQLPVESQVNIIEEVNKTLYVHFLRNYQTIQAAFVAPDLMQYALDNAANPTFWYRASNPRFFYVNQAACDYLGYTREELLTMWTGDINPTQTKESQQAVIDKLSNQHSLLFETEHQTKSGEIVPVEVLVKMVHYEGEGYIISFVRDITKRKQAEADLKEAKDRAEEASLAKSAFLANMSHEIRTPLTAIIGFSDTALRDNKTEEQRIKALKTIHQSGDHLLHLINDILDFSKIEAGEMDIEKVPVNIHQLLSEVETMVKIHANRKSLTFSVEHEFPLPVKIISDPLRLKQILLNLCSNAIKFTDSGFIKIKPSYHLTRNILNLDIIDTGIGLSAAEIDKIFLPFKQADTSTTRRYGGTGLGLSLSSRLTELLNGELTVKSETGKGSTFRISLKLDPEANHPENIIFQHDSAVQNEENSSLKTSSTKLQGEILLAEDDILNQELISMYLTDMGARVTLANNGEVAISLALKQPFDLIYMDMQMPLLSGSDAVKKLRNAGYKAPIVMLTANVTLDDRKMCQSAGCDDFITKPIDANKLYQVTKRYLKQLT